MGYASIADLTTYGLPATALGALSVPQQQAEVDAASARVDSYLRGRYALPLVAWGVEITEATCRIAAFNLLSVRGYNPAAGADENIRERYVDAIEWLERVQSKAAHPAITPAADQSPTYNQPFVLSSSVVAVDSGRTAATRGW